jgi:hypothetical protein
MKARSSLRVVALIFAAVLAAAPLFGQAVVTIPAINPNYNPNAGDKPIIPRLPHTGSKPPLDPNDYIGVDISKMSSSQRAKIESAFRKHTGEGFTGSQYDPNSPKFAYGPKPATASAKQDGITAEKLLEIKTVVENYKTKKISQETALKFLETIGVTKSEAAKILQ